QLLEARVGGLVGERASLDQLRGVRLRALDDRVLLLPRRLVRLQALGAQQLVPCVRARWQRAERLRRRGGGRGRGGAGDDRRRRAEQVRDPRANEEQGEQGEHGDQAPGDPQQDLLR